MTNDVQFLTEMFNLKSAKGYEYEVTDMKTVTIPEIRYQATFTTDSGVEFAFRVYRANSMAGRHYGPHTRLLSFMRKKSRNFSQNITIDKGSFKKVLVTFMRCYEDYKENSKDGKKSSSYAVVMQDSLRPYASLFVRATRRAFKNNKRIHLDLVGVNEEGKAKTLELMYVNPISMYPAFGGKDYDTANFVGNPTHVQLAKFAGKNVDGSDSNTDPIDTTQTSVAQAVSTPIPQNQQSAVSAVAPVVSTPDPVVAPHVAGVGDRQFNPDDIPGVNDPENFNDDFITSVFTAEGRDALESVLKEYKIHRRFLAHNIDRAVEMWSKLYASEEYRLFKVDAMEVVNGIGFYIHRDKRDFFPTFLAMVARNNENITIELMNKLINNGLADLDVGIVSNTNSRVMQRLLGSFVHNSFEPEADNYKNPIADQIEVEYNLLKRAMNTFRFDIDGTFNYALFDGYIYTSIRRFIACVTMNFIDDTQFKTEDLRERLKKHGHHEPINLSTDYAEYRAAIAHMRVTPNIKVLGDDPSATFNFEGFYAILDGNPHNYGNPLMEYIEMEVVPFNRGEALGKHIATSGKLGPSRAGEVFGYLFRRLDDTSSDSSIEVTEAFIAYLDNAKLSWSVIARELTMFKRELHRRVASTLIGSAQDVLSYFQSIFDNDLNPGSTNDLSYAIIKWAVHKGYFNESSYSDLFKLIASKSRGSDSGSNAFYRYGTYGYHLTIILRNVMPSMSNRSIELLYDYTTNPKDLAARRTLFTAVGDTGNASNVSHLYDYALSKDEHTNFDDLIDPMVRMKKPSESVDVLIELFKKKPAKYSTGDNSFSTIRTALTSLLFTDKYEQLERELPEEHLDILLRGSFSALSVVDGRSGDSGDDIHDVSPRAVNGFIDSLSNSSWGEKKKTHSGYGSEPWPNDTLARYMENLTEDMFNKMTPESFEKFKVMLGNIQATSTTKRSVYAPILDSMSGILAELDKSKYGDRLNEVLEHIGDREARLMLKTVARNLTLNRYMEEMRHNAKIKIQTDLNQKGIKGILDFNSIPMPAMPNVTAKDDFEKVKQKVAKVNLGLPEEQVEEIPLTSDELLDLTIEYDAFSRRKHNLSLVIEGAFNVSLPNQVEGRARWDAKMEAEGIDSKIMNPVFHGTGSIPASMILRLGFAVLSFDESKKHVPTAGRMLGDGIYFSTAIDKVAQYSADRGYSREIGARGYIFEMNVSLGKHRRDFREGGTGAKISEYNGRLVSPEWAVFTPNEQCLITKAYKIKRVPHNVIDKIKKERSMVNESSNITPVRGFRQAIRESLELEDMKMITFIFSDYQIPVSDSKTIDFMDYNNELGDSVRVESAPYGVIVSIPDTIDMAQGGESIDTYHIAMTNAFITVKDDPLRNQYLKLINRVPVA